MSKAPRWTEEQLAEHQERRTYKDAQGKAVAEGPVVRTVELGGQASRVKDDSVGKPHKYRAEPTVIDGIRFDSKLEGRYYKQLKLRQASGYIQGFLRQVPFHLPGKTRLVVDFGIVENDGTIWFADTKGFETDAFKIKIRQVRELYPWARIEIVKRGDF